MVTVTVKEIEKILKKYPTLNYNGFGLFFEGYRLREEKITGRAPTIIKKYPSN